MGHLDKITDEIEMQLNILRAINTPLTREEYKEVVKGNTQIDWKRKLENL